MTLQEKGGAATWPVEIIRSARRRKTVSAALRNGVLVVRAPAQMTEAELQPLVEKLRGRLRKRVRRPRQSDANLQALAEQVNGTYFDGRLRWQSIRFVNNQHKRFGSCTPATGSVRISRRVAGLPEWVLRYVVIHELAHLEEANHGPRFWALVNRYPLTERARGYLMAVDLEEESER
jgi:predicted metal-dependent hydrolase